MRMISNNLLLTPKNYTSADIFLVSYPRSGSTWLRFLIANAIKIHCKIEREINFFTIQDIIPDIHISRNVHQKSPFAIPYLPRIIKSHCPYNPYYKRVIFLVRDPRDVMISYYHHLTANKSLPLDLTLSRFIRHRKYGVKRWIHHTKSWTSTRKKGRNIQLFTYENLYKDTGNNLSRIMELLGLKILKPDLEKAIQLSSKENMKKLEIYTRPTISVSTQSSAFVRQGEPTSGHDLSEEDKIFIEKNTRSVAGMLGYQY